MKIRETKDAFIFEVDPGEVPYPEELPGDYESLYQAGARIIGMPLDKHVANLEALYQKAEAEGVANLHKLDEYLAIARATLPLWLELRGRVSAKTLEQMKVVYEVSRVFEKMFGKRDDSHE